MKHLLSFRKHRSWKTLVIGFFLFNSSLFAQNLVVNPSFEDVNIGSLQCSWYTTVAQFNNAINNWTLPTGGSTDIFNTALATTCYSSPFSTNGSSPGTQAPRTGNGYCNIVTYGNGGCDPWREYLQGELTSALVVGQTYEVEMWVTLADKMSVGTNNIGVKFSTNTYTQGGNCGYYTTPDLNYTGPIILDKQNWVQILFCYTPTTAGLDNFIIGNFYNDAATTTAAASGVTTANTIRYFVEDVRIELAVGGPGDAGTNGAIALCNGDLATDLFNSLGGIPDMTGTWSGPSVLAGGYLGTFDPGINVAGTYTYTVNGGAGLCAAGGGLATAEVVVTINPDQDATIIPVGPFCPTDPAIVMLGVNPGGTWSGTGITNPATGAFDPAVAGPGTWTITYTLANPCGDVQTFDVVVNNLFDATITPVGPFCPTDAAIVMIGVDPGGTWSGTGITNPATGAFDPAAAGPGTWTITYTIGGACGDVQTYDVVINPNQDATITPVGPFCPTDPAIVMLGVNPGGTWSGTGITNPATGAFDPAVAGPGTWTITYTLANPCGDVQTFDVVVNNLFDATITPVGPFCPTDAAIVMIGVDPGGTWSGTGITNPATGAFDPAAAGPGTWTITYTIGGACGDVQTYDVVINPIPVIDFSVNNIVGCAPLDVIFTNNSVPQGTNCLWDFGDGSSSTICGAAAHQFNDVGCYNITLTVSEGGCSNSLTQTSMVCVVEDPIANFTISTEFVDVLDPEIHFTNTSSSATSYIWDFGDGAGSSEVNPTHQYGYTPGEYIVCLTAMIDFGCLDEICKPVLVQEGLTFYLPNSFTPDGDQHNQMFKPVFTSGFDPYDFSLLIFDRWGEVIWESNDTSVGWDGIYNGKLVQSGTYVWKVEFKTLSTDERIVNTGHVNVIR